MRHVPLLAFLPSPPENGFHVGPLFFRAYGICYVFAVLGAVVATTRRWEKVGGDGALVQECALWGFPAGLIGGRLYFLATSWNEVPDAWWGPFAIWRGGLGIWGGIAGGVGAGIWGVPRRGANISLFVDCVSPRRLVAPAIWRLGDWFKPEAFGGPPSRHWGLRMGPG